SSFLSLSQPSRRRPRSVNGSENKTAIWWAVVTLQRTAFGIHEFFPAAVPSYYFFFSYLEPDRQSPFQFSLPQQCRTRQNPFKLMTKTFYPASVHSSLVAFDRRLPKFRFLY
ncbi:unnamed protein product, partial [Linum tenue]